MTLLYLTADQIGEETGGGAVTCHECKALSELGETLCVSRKDMLQIWDNVRDDIDPRQSQWKEPWLWDQLAFYSFGTKHKLAHVYAGTFPDCVRKLKEQGTIVTYTAAAHDVNLSKQEHEKLGVPFSYPHLTDPVLWEKYLDSYRRADVVICPSTHSKSLMQSFGCERVEIIPHGVNLPKETKPLPERFTVGYLGAVGPDKGLIYLLQAWNQLNYKDAQLLISGRDSQSPFVRHLVSLYGGDRSDITLGGWVEDVADFYGSISLYVQPSVTEGFGLEVLEAMAHGRCVIATHNTGAADLLPVNWQVPICDPNTLADRIDKFKRSKHLDQAGRVETVVAQVYAWEKIRERYKNLWRSLL